MTASLTPLTNLPALDGAMPPRPEDLYRLHKLCLRIYGLLCRDIPDQAQALASAPGLSLKRKNRQALVQTLEEELPVLLALYALERLAKDQRLGGENLTDLLRGLLLPCFSLSYQRMYDQPADPLKHVLARIDWYLDGEKGEPLDAFAHFASTILGDQVKEPEPLLQHLEASFLPEMDRRLELAFRYEFA